MQKDTTSRYRVLRILHRTCIAGPVYHATYLTHYLNDEFETLLVSGAVEPTEMDGKFILDELGVKPKFVENMKRPINFKLDVASYHELRAIIREFKPHIVHTHAAKSGALGRLAAFHEKVPVVLHTFHGHVFHSYFGKLKSQVFLQIERYLGKRSTRIIAISEQQKRELGDVYKVCDKNRIVVIPLGLDLEKFNIDNNRKRAAFRDEFQLKELDIAVGIIGRVTEVKNHVHFIHSFKALIDKSEKNIKGFIVGGGNLMTMVKDLATSLGLTIADSVNANPNADLYFTSWREDVDTIMNGLDILALTSLNEGTPVTLIEAQACKTPIVSTRVGGVVDVVRENETALLSEANDVEAFANNLYRLVEDPQLREEFGSRGDFVFDSFSYQRLVKDVGTLYQELIKDYETSRQEQ